MGLCLVPCIKNPEVPVSNPLDCFKVHLDVHLSEATFGKSKLPVPNVAMGQVNSFHRKKVTTQSYF